MAIIVSILSEQLIPNVLFIKQMGKASDKHLFVSTEEMEKKEKSSILTSVLNITEDKVTIVKVDPNSPINILGALEKYDYQEGESYIVNITGGNKMMSQMAYNFFSRYNNSKIYYWPIGSNYLEQLFPEMREIKIDQVYQLDLKTYIASHGYTYSCQNKLSYPIQKAEVILNKVIKRGSSEEVREIVNAKSQAYTKHDKQYLLGIWFEEWLYDYLKRILQLQDNQIAFNLKLKNNQSVRRTESDNEMDVAFVYNNKLYVWECKVFYSSQINGKKISDPVYKISSVCQSLGLQAVSLVIIAAKFGDSAARKDFIKDLTKIMRIERVFALEDMISLDNFESQVKAMVGF
jgi:hypothetical protein